MNHRCLLAITLLTIACGSGAANEPGAESAGTRALVDDWRFHKGEAPGAGAESFDDADWRRVDLPHDWSIEGPKRKNNPGGSRLGYFPTGIGWYRKHFSLSPSEQDKKVFVQFDGVYRNSEVWINGHSLGRRPYGYTSFQLDLTPHITFGGENVLAVRVDNASQPSSRWYTGSGIYRPVRLQITDRLHVKHWGTTITTPEVSRRQALVRVVTEVINEHDTPQEFTLVTRIIGPERSAVTEATETRELSPGEDVAFNQTLTAPAPKLWSIEHPEMYAVETQITRREQVVDARRTPFGIRQIALDNDRGFLLNGERVKLKGVNLHHDAGCLGAAVPKRAWRRRLEILKSLGCNAIRTSHNPPAPELLNLCDRMGFLVIDEAFDKWGKPYVRSFPQWGMTDLADMIRRDRNHPSIVMWSVGNELENQGDSSFLKQLDLLVERARETDPTRPVTVALRPKAVDGERMTREVVRIASRVDAISCNYQEQWFDDYRRADPEILVIGSEIYPYYRGRGDNYKAFYPVNPWLDAHKHDYVLGSFYWTGIDYLGEAVAGWPFHGWNGSLIDTCGWVRPVGQLAKSFWSDRPMVHIAVMDESLDVPAPTKDHWGWPKMASHWNLPLPKGDKVKVVTFTNCEEVELFVNGVSQGRKRLDSFEDRVIAWEVPYAPGVIQARGVNQEEVEATHELRTAGDPVRMRLNVDRDSLRADGRDLCYVDVEITDESGVLTPAADDLVHFSIKGPGRIIGVDNGDLTSNEPYQANSRHAHYGRVQAVVQATRGAGRIVLGVTAAGLPPQSITIDVR